MRHENESEAVERLPLRVFLLDLSRNEVDARQQLPLRAVLHVRLVCVHRIAEFVFEEGERATDVGLVAGHVMSEEREDDADAAPIAVLVVRREHICSIKISDKEFSVQILLKHTCICVTLTDLLIF